MRTAFFPSVANEYVVAEVRLPEGGAFSYSLEVLGQIEGDAVQPKAEYNAEGGAQGGPLIGHINSRAAGSEVRTII